MVQSGSESKKGALPEGMRAPDEKQNGLRDGAQDTTTKEGAMVKDRKKLGARYQGNLLHESKPH